MKESLSDRMKYYESVSSHSLAPKIPVIGRIDGKNFSSFTAKMEKPFDIKLQHVMMIAAKYLAENFQGCKLVYTQSDEINILLTDFEKENTQGAFNYRLEKLCSIAASQVTSAFLAAMMNYFPDRQSELRNGNGLPAFDARFFSLPKDEVVNYFIFRQQDGIRNSIQMMARSLFSQKECYKKSTKELKEMILDKGGSWEKLPIYTQRGTCIIKVPCQENINIPKDNFTISVERMKWTRDLNIPIFSEQKDYIQKLIE